MEGDEGERVDEEEWLAVARAGECSFACRSSLIALTAQLQASTYGSQFRVDFGEGMRDVGERTGRTRGIERAEEGKKERDAALSVPPKQMSLNEASSLVNAAQTLT